MIQARADWESPCFRYCRDCAWWNFPYPHRLGWKPAPSPNHQPSRRAGLAGRCGYPAATGYCSATAVRPDWASAWSPAANADRLLGFRYSPSQAPGQGAQAVQRCRRRKGWRLPATTWVNGASSTPFRHTQRQGAKAHPHATWADCFCLHHTAGGEVHDIHLGATRGGFQGAALCCQ